MKLNDLKEMCQKDTKIDGSDLDGYSISIPELANKYHQLRHEEKNTLRFFERQYKTLKLSRWLYYSGKANENEYEDKPFDLKVLKTDMDMFLDADTQIMDIKDKIEETARIIQNASFNISNTIKWKKFLSGDLT